MDFAIIAAGKGSRMVSEGETVPKPLVKIGGKPMIKRIIDAFTACGATSVSIIINEDMHEVSDYLNSLKSDVRINIIVKNTPGSMHSFFELKDYLKDDCFCLSTVDSVFENDAFIGYVNEFKTRRDADGYMAVTSFIDDEYPLYVQENDQGSITCFSDVFFEGASLVSGGIYILNRSALDVLDRCMNQGITDMRDFQRQLLVNRFNLRAYKFDKIVDVDHSYDIDTANKFIAETEKTLCHGRY